MQKEPWNTIPRLYLRPDTSHSLIHLALYHMQKSCQVFKCLKIAQSSVIIFLSCSPAGAGE